MPDVRQLPRDVEVKRSDPVYMAHAYLTKVPVPAITPFIEAFTEPGDVVLDLFAGSGMTGVAAAVSHRRARLFDISVLGRHIGRGYVQMVDSDALRRAGQDVASATYERLAGVYETKCSRCAAPGMLAKTVWSYVVECDSCAAPVNFYRSLEAGEWRKDAMRCPTCSGRITSKSRRIGEEPCVDFINSDCSPTQVEQHWTPALAEPSLAGLDYPDLPIDPSRQMYAASALARNGLKSTAAFFSQRNLMALAILRDEIARVTDETLREKLLFAFTAILARASKRYQWSRQRPLNAANANYYVAPVFYEWNVLDLFKRKVEAVIKANDWIAAERRDDSLFASEPIDVTYERASAVALPLADDSVDYVFTDPPFGSNIFYADMNLFHEAWLGETTTTADEAVVDRSKTSAEFRSAERYEQMLTSALQECRRVLKPDGRLSMVFGNSSGDVWSLVQRAVAGAGFVIDPDLIATLNKGQRSVKGLASGFENVATIDLILTMTQTTEIVTAPGLRPTHEEVRRATVRLAQSSDADTPSHLYVELLRFGLREGWDLGSLDLRDVTSALVDTGYDVDPKSGRMTDHQTVRTELDGIIE